MIEVLVASQNQVKADAVQAAFERYFEQEISVDLAKNNIDSGVSPQPLSIKETAQGALNRLGVISSETGYDYYVAIEGGAYSLDLPHGQHWYETACCALKTADADPSVAFGPAYPIPDNFIEHLLKGRDLNEAMEAETGIKEAGNDVGFNGWISKNTITRKDACVQAILLAVAGFEYNDKPHILAETES